jgi:hypothetical protein
VTKSGWHTSSKSKGWISISISFSLALPDTTSQSSIEWGGYKRSSTTSKDHSTGRAGNSNSWSSNGNTSNGGNSNCRVNGGGLVNSGVCLSTMLGDNVLAVLHNGCINHGLGDSCALLISFCVTLLGGDGVACLICDGVARL